MKKVFLLIALLMCLVFSVPIVAATPTPNFYAVGVNYQAIDCLQEVQGEIITAFVSATKAGMAGIEADVCIKTETGHMVVEIVNWYYGEGVSKVGTVVYNDEGFQEAHRASASIGEFYHWIVYIHDGCVWTEFSDEQGKVLKDAIYHAEVGALYIDSVDTYVEYWRYDEPGSFFYYGCVTINPTWQLAHKDDYYYQSKGYPFELYHIHHNWNGITDKGEIDDR